MKRKTDLFRIFNNVPKIYMPMIWFELKVQIPEEMASNLKKLLALPTVMLSIGIAMIAIGLGLIGTILFLYFKKKRHAPTMVYIRFLKLFNYFCGWKENILKSVFITTYMCNNFIGYHGKGGRRII